MRDLFAIDPPQLPVTTFRTYLELCAYHNGRKAAQWGKPNLAPYHSFNLRAAWSQGYKEMQS